MEIKTVLNKLIERQDLTLAESEELIDQMAEGLFTPLQVAAVLTALRIKGESVLEITGFIKGMRKHMVKIKAKDAIDIVGTGGDGKGTFNISTASSLVVAGTGVKVAKHGNRAASSKAGSADTLEALGVNFQLTPHQAEDILEKIGIVFLFAPLFHPAMKHIAPVRAELGFRTVFNFLGPFLNPAGVKRKLLGVPNREIAQKLAQVAKNLGYEHLILISSKDGLDEISLSSQTLGFEVKAEKIQKFTISPSKHNFKKVNLKHILGGEAKDNAEIIKSILNGEKGPKRDIVLLNSAYALLAAGKVKNIKAGVKLAKESIDSGKAMKVLENLIKETQKYA